MKLKIIGPSKAEHVRTAQKLQKLYNELLEKKYKGNAEGWHQATEKARSDIIAKQHSETKDVDWHAVNLAMLRWCENELGIASNSPAAPRPKKPLH